jgi:nitrate reductase alpha subunit
MISDDNFNALQKTLLVYFELAHTDDPGTGGNSPEFEPRQQIRN